MAGEYGTFTPTESAYTKPGAYKASVLAEATKRGSYLSAMDQFYAQLDQLEKQFEESLSFKRKQLASEETRQENLLDWYREQEAGRLGLAQEQMQTQKYIAGMGTRKSDAELRREAAMWNVEPEEKAGEEIPLSWLSEQIQRIYPSEEISGEGGRYEAPAHLTFSNPMMGTEERFF